MIQPIKPSEIPQRNRGRSNKIVEEDLRDFMNTSDLAGKVRYPDGQTAKSAYQSYRKAIIRKRYPLDIMVRGEDLFIRKRTALGAGTPKGGKGK